MPARMSKDGRVLFKSCGTLLEIQKIALSRGGKCLSTKFVGMLGRYMWECGDGHQWEASGNIVKGSSKIKGTWCPDCTTGLSERLCKCFLETMLDCKFMKVKPTWLLNSRGNRMELDGLNTTLNIAFEYNGEQHYKIIKNFKMTDKLLQQRKEDDKTKIILCRINGIKLIVIPTFDKSFKIEDLPNFIVEKYRNLDINFSRVPKFDDTILSSSYHSNKLSKCKEIANSRGGDLLSKTFLGVNKNLIWICASGHSWSATPKNVINGSWCRVCSENKPLISQVKELAKSRNGECLSDIYINALSPLMWRCNYNHTWTTNFSNVKNGSWCGICSRTKTTIDQLRLIARSQGGDCLSENYSSKEKLTWICKNNHIWKTTASSILYVKTWCQVCKGRAKLTIESMKKLANDRGGVCISDTYVNNSTKLTWKCSDGHVWNATPHSIKSGKTWCPSCNP